jgi:16S rRNA (guanine527-N7)-methyltransferase
VDSEAARRLLVYAGAVNEWNRRLNLVSRSDAPLLVSKHFAPSAALLTVRSPAAGERWLDVGSGAGFPGLVIGMLRPDASIVLVDSSRKRCVFLEHVARSVGLTRIEVRPSRAEALAAPTSPDANGFDVVLSRAVAALDAALLTFGPLVVVGGEFLIYKGPAWQEELEAAGDSLKASGLHFDGCVELGWAGGRVLRFRRPVATQDPAGKSE